MFQKLGEKVSLFFGKVLLLALLDHRKKEQFPGWWIVIIKDA